MQSQDDRIDVSAIDADTSVSGIQAFKFVGTAAFKGIAGELRYAKNSTDTYIYGDNDGDKIAEFRIHLSDVVNLVTIDFIL